MLAHQEEMDGNRQASPKRADRIGWALWTGGELRWQATGVTRLELCLSLLRGFAPLQELLRRLKDSSRKGGREVEGQQQPRSEERLSERDGKSRVRALLSSPSGVLYTSSDSPL